MRSKFNLLAVAALFGLLFSLAIGSLIPLRADLGTSAILVHSVLDDVQHGYRNNTDLFHTDEDTTLGRRQLLRIGGDGVSEATLGFLDRYGEALNSPLVAAGRSRVVSHYYYSPRECRSSGEFVIGWTAGRPLNNSDSSIRPACENVRHSPGILIGPAGQSKPQSNSYASRYLKNDFRLNFQNYIDTAAPVHLHYHCSASEDGGSGWGVALSDQAMSPRTLGSNTDESVRLVIDGTCQKAITVCEERSDGSCSITNEDPWRIDAAIPEFKSVNLILKCQNGQYRKASGITLDEISTTYTSLEEEAINDEAASCIFSIQYFYEILISPLNDERTLIHTTLAEEGYAVHDLVGSVRITVTNTSGDTAEIDLNPGDRFLFDYLADSVEKQPKENIPISERNAAANHPLVKTFLNVDNWPQNFEPEINAYRQSLQQQFLPPVSAELVSVTLNNVNYQVWKASVNLSNPSLAFSLVKDCSVNGSSSFSRFAQEQQAVLVMGGIYGGQNRCDPLNYPLYSEGQLQAGIRQPQPWTQGTVLGMRPSPTGRGVVADIQTFNAEGSYSWSSEQATWDGYLFAVTSGPRLLANGQVVYSEQAARAQGHTDPNVTNPTRRAERAALCLSRDKQEFSYVIAQQPPDLNLVELSNILSSAPVGCWDAVNLDGGGGPALAVNGDVKNPPGREQPYLMVVYDAENAPSQTRAAWNFP